MDVVKQVQKEDWIKWAQYSFTETRMLEHLWIPKFHGFSELGAFLFAKEIHHD